MTAIDRVIFNTRERLTSDDLNAAQSRAHRSMNAGLAAIRGYSVMNPWEQPGQGEFTLTDTYLPCDVFCGLRVLCHTSGYLYVEPGVAGFHEASLVGTDDYSYTTVESSGLSANLLPWVAPTGGSPVWRFVEMRLVDSLTANQFVDIWNILAKTFNLGTREKRRQGTLEFRIREATSAGALPSPDAAWVPIAAFMAYPASTGFTECAFYDVRPLVQDRDQLGMRLLPDHARNVGTGSGAIWPVTDEANYYSRSSDNNIRGSAEVWALGYRAGGLLKNSTPAPTIAKLTTTAADGGEAPFFSPLDAVNKSPSWTVASGDMYAVYAVFPGGLPRWVKYSNVGARSASGPRGLLVSSSLIPGSTYQNKTGLTSLQLPAGCNLTGVHPAVQVAYGVVRRDSAIVVGSAAGSGKRWDCNPDSADRIGPTTNSGAPGLTTSWAILPRGTKLPNRARLIRLATDFQTEVVAIQPSVVNPQPSAPWCLVVRASMGASMADNGLWEDVTNFYFESRIMVDAVPWQMTSGVWVQEIQTVIEVPTPCDMSTLSLDAAASDIQLGFQIQPANPSAVRWYSAYSQVLRIVGWEE